MAHGPRGFRHPGKSTVVGCARVVKFPEKEKIVALIKCTDCGNSISDSAETCIHCGKPLASKSEDRSLYVNNPNYCQKCLRDGNVVLLISQSKSETPGGAGCMAWGLIILGVPGLLFWGSGLLLILTGILILALAKKEVKSSKCPICHKKS
jgi:hypothetical protein